MADASEYAAWIVANKEKQGTPEFAKVQAAYEAARQPSESSPAPTKEFLDKERTRSVGPATDGMSGVQKTLAGVVGGLQGAAQAGNQLMSRIPNPFLSKDDQAANQARTDAYAENQRALRSDLTDTTEGKIGDMVGRMIPQSVPLAKAVQVAKLIPKIPMAAKALAGTSLGGALSGLLDNEGANYNPEKQAEIGAVAGPVGSVVGSAAGAVLKPPIKAASEAVKEQVKTLQQQIFRDKAQGVIGGEGPKLIAENLTENPNIRQLTNALAQIPVANAGVVGARERNGEWITRHATQDAGTQVPSMTSSNAKALHDNVNPDAPGGMATGYVPVTGIRRLINQLMQPDQDALGILGLGRPNQQANQAMYGINQITTPNASGMYTPVMKARTLMDVRANLDDEAHNLSKSGQNAIQDAIDATMERHRGPDYPDWLHEYGRSKDIRAAQSMSQQGNAAGVTKSGHLQPEFMASRLGEAVQANPQTPYEKLMVAGGQRMSTPSLAENRSLGTRILMGAPFAGGIAGGVAGGPAAGAGVTAGSLYLAHLLLGTEAGGRYLTGNAQSKLGKLLQDPKTIEMLRRAGIMSGTDVATTD